MKLFAGRVVSIGVLVAAMAATAAAALILRRIGKLLLRQLGQDRLVQPDAAFQILERKILVR